jgi:hypothetical protein
VQERPPRTQRKSPWHSWLLPALVLLVVFYACALPIVFSGHAIEGRAAADQLNYHEPVIHVFADQWPRPDLSNYFSATTPLYHLVLAGVEVAFEPSRRWLMLTGSLFTAGLLVLLVGSLRVEPRRALVLSLPVLCSMYVFFPGVWILPDNAGWLGVLGILVLSLRRPMRGWTLFWAGILLLELVLVRQIHLWAAAMVWTAAWLGADGDDEFDLNRPIEAGRLIAALFSDLSVRIRRVIPAVLVTLPAFAAIGYFVWLWGGVVVPRYQAGDHGGYHGWNPATAAFHLSIVGSFVPFFFGYMAPGLRRLMRSPGLLVGIVVLALVLVVVPETSYAAEVGRKSGLWNLVKIVPVIGGHTSPVLLVLAPVGAVGIASLLAQLRARCGWIYLGAFTAFVAAQTMSPQLWQRYHEPFILIVLVMMSAEALGDAEVSRAVRVWRWVGPLVLALIFASVSARTVLTDRAAVSLKTGDFERSRAYEPLE